MVVAWLANYPINLLALKIKKVRNKESHPSSWIVNLSNALAKNGNIDLHLISESSVIPYSQILHFNNITFHIIKGGIPFLNREFPNFMPIDILTRFYLNSHRIIREIHRIKPDLVHCHGTEAQYALSGVKSGYPCVISLQGIINEIFKISPSFRFRIVRKLEKKQIENCKNFFCRTHFDKNFVLSHNKNANIYNINEAMNPVFFESEWKVSNSNRILFVGYLIKRKGVENLIQSISIIKQEIPNILLYLIGSGHEGYVNFLKDECKRLGILQHVVFLGPKSAEEISKYHIDSQIFALPSENENSPNSVAEAMVSGMPVIATDVGGISSMITNNKTGILIRPNDPNELASKITFLLKNPDKRQELSENSKAIARARHEPSQVAEKTIEVYKEILSTAK